MLAITASGIGKIDTTAVSGSKTKGKDEKAAETFASLMNISSTVNTDVDTATTNLQSKTKVEKTSDAQANQNEYRADAGQVKQPVKESAKTDTGSDVETQVKDIPADEMDSVMAEEVLVTDDQEMVLPEVISEILQNLMDFLQNQLGISDDEVNQLLEQMDMKLSDLLDFSNLRGFVLKAEAMTEVDLLINEDVSRMVEQLMDDFAKFLQENNISDVENVQVVLEKFISNPETLQENPQLLQENPQMETVEPEVNFQKNPENPEKPEILSQEREVQVPVAEESANMAETGTRHEENGNGVVENLNHAISQITSGQELTEVVEFADNIQEADIVRQIIDEIKVNITKEVTSLELQLNPEHLGKVQISVSTRNGIMQAQIVAETEAAKQAIENNLAVLRETFNNQELKVEAIEVMVATYEFSRQGQEDQFANGQQKQTEKGTNGINLGDETEDELTEAEQLEAEIMKAQGNSVSYSI